MSRPDAEKVLALIAAVVARTLPGGDLSDRDAISIIMGILETGGAGSKPSFRVIDVDQKEKKAPPGDNRRGIEREG